MKIPFIKRTANAAEAKQAGKPFGFKKDKTAGSAQSGPSAKNRAKPSAKKAAPPKPSLIEMFKSLIGASRSKDEQVPSYELGTYLGHKIALIRSIKDIQALQGDRSAILMLSGPLVAGTMESANAVDGFIQQPPRKTYPMRIGVERTPPMYLHISKNAAAFLQPYRTNPIGIIHDSILSWARKVKDAVLLMYIPGSQPDDHISLTQWSVEAGRIVGYREINMIPETSTAFDEEFATSCQDAQRIAAGRPIYIGGPKPIKRWAEFIGLPFIGLDPLRKPISGPVTMGYINVNLQNEGLIPALLIAASIIIASGTFFLGSRSLNKERENFKSLSGAVTAEYKEGEKALALLNSKKSYLATSKTPSDMIVVLKKAIEATSQLDGAVLVGATVAPNKEVPGQAKFSIRIALVPNENISAVEQGEAPLKLISERLGVPLVVDKPTSEPVVYISRTLAFRIYNVEGSIPLKPTTKVKSSLPGGKGSVQIKDDDDVTKTAIAHPASGAATSAVTGLAP